MPSAGSSVAWGTFFLALGVIVGGSFLITYLSTDLGRVARTPYVGLLAIGTGVMTWAYLLASRTDATEFLRTGWAWGLVGAVVAGGIAAVQARRLWPAGARPRGPALIAKLVWEGLVYGATEGMLLSILPVLAVWQGADALGWTDAWPAKVGVGALAIAASMVVIAVHHFGYREFRGAVVRYPIIACSLFSLAYLLTGSVIAAIGGHIILHFAANLSGTELPPEEEATHLDHGTIEPLPRVGIPRELVAARR
jgi:hypothetical protein